LKQKGAEGKDDSFLPLDEDGYCLRHPDVQMAKMSKKGGLRILMDVCPKCAEASLVVGGSIGGDDKLRRKTSVTSASCRSGDSHSTFIESMPYIDGDGKPGHYTGHVDREGQPNGQGKMKYISGAKYDGVWHEGTKLHGKTSSKKRSDKNGSTSQLSRQETPPTPAPPPPPPPPLLPAKKLPGQKNPTGGRAKSSKRPENEHGREHKDGSNHRSSRQERSHQESFESTSSSSRRPRRSLSRLRRKCDEIESLLKGYPNATKDV